MSAPSIDVAKRLLSLKRSRASIVSMVKRGDYPPDYGDVLLASIDADIVKVMSFSVAQQTLPISEAKRK